MGTQLDDRVITPGDVVPVKNLESKINECEEYMQIWVEDADGGNERPLLLSKKEVENLAEIHPCDILDKMKMGRIYDFGKSNIVKVEVINGVQQVVFLPKSLIKRGETRAAKNKEDIVKVGVLIDWLT